MREFGFAVAGLLVGFAVGSTGVGGGSLMTPMLITFYGVSPVLAVGTDLLYASISKGFATLLHKRRGSLDWRLTALQASGSLPAVMVTLWVLHNLEDPAQLAHTIRLVLSIAITVTASFTFFQEKLLHSLRRHSGTSLLTDGQRRACTIATGVLIGALVTVSSVGAGVIGLMLLMLLYPQREPIHLIGSDLAHAALVTAIAGLGHASLRGVDYRMLLALLAGGFPGIWIGVRVGFRMNPQRLKRALAFLLIIIGITTFAKAAVPN